MLNSFIKLLLLLSIVSIISSCKSTEAEYTFDKKLVSSVESKDRNIVVHFKDNTTQSFSATQVEKLLKEKKIGENVYQLFAQKIKDVKAKQPRPTDKTDKEKYPYRLNGRDVHFIEFKDDKFSIHLADKTSQSFSQHEIDCMMINKIITIETYVLCMQKQNEENISHRKDSSFFSFSAKEIKCPEFE